MKIATLTMNPAVDKSSAVDQVVAEWKLRCEPPAYSRAGEALMSPGPFVNWAAIPWLSTRQAGCPGRCWQACWTGREYQQAVAALGGYDLKDCGKIIWEQ